MGVLRRGCGMLSPRFVENFERGFARFGETGTRPARKLRPLLLPVHAGMKILHRLFCTLSFYESDYAKNLARNFVFFSSFCLQEIFTAGEFAVIISSGVKTASNSAL